MKGFVSIAEGGLFLACTAYAQQSAEKPKQYAGYPLCSMILEPRIERDSGGGDASNSTKSCSFTNETPVYVLKLLQVHGTLYEFAKSVPIEEINPGFFVLASAEPGAADPSPPASCWASVLWVNRELAIDGKDSLVQTSYQSDGKSFELVSTSDPRFLIENRSGAREWKMAKDWRNGDRLFEARGHEAVVFPTTSEIDPRHDVGGGLLGFGGGAEGEFVYNLRTDVNTYYVGPVNAQMLVRN